MAKIDPQAGGRIHGVFLLGREERVFNLGTPGPSDRTRRTPISRVRFGIANLGTPAPGHVACLHVGARWRVTKIPGRTTRRRQPSRVATSASNLREPRRQGASRWRWRSDRSGGRVGCEHTQPTTACKQQLAPRALYYLFFPTHHSLYVVSSEAAAYYSLVYTAVCLLNKAMRLRRSS